MKDLKTECRKMQEDIVAIRRELHKIPETGTYLPKTRKYVTGILDSLGIDYSLNREDSGIIAYINRCRAGKTVALRADMDALPITEETGAEYASVHEGRMHACGHDSHTAMLLGAAKVLKKHEKELRGEVRLIFQTAEELAKGALVMIRNGAVDGVDAVFGMHVGKHIDKDVPAGTAIICPGPVMASFDRFVITVRGKGCHGSTPERGIDPINAAAHIILGLEAIVAREFNANVPAVISAGKICGGTQYNIIPDTVVIEGTTRSFDEAVRKKMAVRIGEVAEGCAKAFGAEADTFMDWGAPPVINSAELADFAAETAGKVLGKERVITRLDRPNMAGEDFAYYLEQVRGAFILFSTASPGRGTDFPHHNPRFNIDEDVLWEGSALLAQLAADYLG